MAQQNQEAAGSLEASLRKLGSRKLPWDTLDVGQLYMGRARVDRLSVEPALYLMLQPCLFLLEALIKTYEVHEEDPVRKCFFLGHRDEQNHEIMCGLAITKMLAHPDPGLLMCQRQTLVVASRRMFSGYISMALGIDWLQESCTQVRPSGSFLFVLMGEIVAATIFKQMFDNSREAVFKEGFKNIGR